MTTEVKATVQYFPMVPFITLNKMILTFECFDEMLNNCNLLNESYPAVSSGDAVYIIKWFW